MQDPGNLGALARVAEAAGAAGLALSPGCAHPNHPRALRASAGSLLRLPVAVGAEPDALDAHLASARPRWTALVPRDGEDLYRARLDGTLILAVGAEGPGSRRLCSTAPGALDDPHGGGGGVAQRYRRGGAGAVRGAAAGNLEGAARGASPAWRGGDRIAGGGARASPKGGAAL